MHNVLLSILLANNIPVHMTEAVIFRDICKITLFYLYCQHFDFVVSLSLSVGCPELTPD